MGIVEKPGPAVVCIVDADWAIRDSLETLIGLNGHVVRGFATGHSFKRRLDSFTPSCVVCEAQLPDLTGFDLYAELLERDIRVPFALLVSGHAEQIRQRAKSAGIHTYEKPLVNTNRLIEFVSHSL